MTEFLKNLWLKLFGTLDWLGLNMGFWVSMAAVILLVVVMIVVFWSLKPKQTLGEDKDEDAPCSKQTDTIKKQPGSPWLSQNLRQRVSFVLRKSNLVFGFLFCSASAKSLGFSAQNRCREGVKIKFYS